MGLNLSIRARLTLFVGAFIVIIVGLTAVATSGLLSVDHKTEAVGGKWLAATQVLDELDDQVLGLRIAETYRALAVNEEARASAEVLAAQNRKEVERLLAEYLTTLGNESPAAEVEVFRAAWKAYLDAHDAWVASDADGSFDDPAQAGSSLHRLFRAAVVAVDRLIEADGSAARAEVQSADKRVDQTILIILIASAAGVALAGWLLLRVRGDITGPLSAITRALAALAAGNRDVRVPELGRDDEIGMMAKAFDVFRANALALEQAHEATREAQEQAQALARHDALTGLPNRRVFSAELQTALSNARHGSTRYSVLMIDLDRFKPVNDLQGHAVGDLVLCEVARRLRNATSKNDIVARLGGDEFAIIGECEAQAHPEAIIRLAGGVIAAIQEPIFVGDGRIEIGASIGVATCPDDGDEPEGLLRAADIAMYRAKRDGRGKFCFFEPRMDEELRAQSNLEADLRKAIAEKKIRPHYQPLVEMHDGNVYGFEILARWQHPERGAVSPDIFIPLAEQLGLISDLTWCLLRQACRDTRQWDEDIHLSLNISPVQLRDPALPAQLLSILNQEGFAPSRLEVEITETALVSDLDTAKLILEALQGLGIKVSLDDFGTGYSSLYHLRELNFDKVKIDRSFVQSMEENTESEKIVDAILSLARSLGLPAVAEGIENPTVLQHLAEMGCDYGQGYYFGKAMTAEQAKGMLRTATGSRISG